MQFVECFIRLAKLEFDRPDALSGQAENLSQTSTFLQVADGFEQHAKTSAILSNARNTKTIQNQNNQLPGHSNR